MSSLLFVDSDNFWIIPVTFTQFDPCIGNAINLSDADLMWNYYCLEYLDNDKSYFIYFWKFGMINTQSICIGKKLEDFIKEQGINE